MKICFLANGHEKDVFTHMFLNHFIKSHEVSLITCQKPVGVNPKVNVYHNTVFQPDVINKDIRPDIIYAIDIFAYGSFAAATKFHPFVLSPLGTDIAVTPGLSLENMNKAKYILQQADIIQVQDLLTAKRAIKLGANPFNTRIVPWGADLNIFKPLNIKKKYDLINLHGGANTTHDIETFIKAFRILQTGIPTINKIILGSKYDGFVEHNRLPEYLCASRIFVDCVCPKHNHGGHTYGMSLIEAMACGVPTIVANRPTIEQLNEWYRGLIFKGGNSIELSYLIQKLLKEEDVQTRIIKENLKTVKEIFDWNKNIKIIEEIVVNETKKK